MRSENFLPNLAIRQRIIPGGQEHRSNMGLPATIAAAVSPAPVVWNG